MAVEDLMRAGLDYGRCTYGSSRLAFRGPCRDGRAEVAVIGGTQVFGKFVERPFPALLEARLGRPVVNLGAMNAGLQAFCDDPVLDEAAAGARAVVFQVPGAESASNAFYSLHPRRNDRVVEVSAALRALYPELDFSEVSFVRGFLIRLSDTCPARFAEVVAELRTNWLRTMRRALARIEAPVVLLWMADHGPARSAARPDPRRSGPLFVTEAMVRMLAGEVAGLVEAVHPATRDADLKAMHFAEFDRSAALSVPCPDAHAVAARALETALGRLLMVAN